MPCLLESKRQLVDVLNDLTLKNHVDLAISQTDSKNMMSGPPFMFEKKTD